MGKTPARTQNFKVKIKSSGTVGEAKNVIAQNCDTPAERQRLIFAGRVLKDHQIISECKIVDGVTVHMVPIPSGSTTQPRSAPTPTPAQPSQPSQPQAQAQTQSPFNLAGMFGDQGNMMQQLQQNFMQNPQMMEQLMQNPLVQQLNQRLMNDPELLRSMMENNPQMRQVMEQNPEVAHIMRDPAMLRQAMELSQNPNLMREMMRNTDRTMANIENIPGGFNLLRQQYENVVEPMQQASQMPDRNESTGNSSEQPPSATPNSDPLPNPWAPGGSQPSASSGSAPNPAGGAAGNANANPFASLFNMFGQQPGQTGQAAGGQQQQAAGLFGMDPAQLNQAMQMASQMFGGAQGGAQGSDAQAGANPQANMFSMMSNLFGQQGGAQGGFSGVGGSGAAAQTPVSSGQQMSPEARFAVQLQQLNDMGFNDQEANIRCLTATAGNVNAAIERLLSGQ